jgi:hypothetical protein
MGSEPLRDPEATAAGELVVDKIQRRPSVRLSLDQYRRSGAHGAATGPALAHGEAFLSIQTVDPIRPDGSPCWQSSTNSRR